VSCTGSICCFWFRGNAITDACGLALGVSGVPEPEAGPSCCSGRSTKAPKHTRRHRRLDPGVTGARVLIIRRTLALGLYGTPWVRSSQTRRSPLFPYGRVSTKARITCIVHASTNLYQLICLRHRFSSLVVVPNRAPKDWYMPFSNPVFPASIIPPTTPAHLDSPLR
jgi:hypothetical protein